MHVEEHTIELGGSPVHYRSAGSGEVPSLYLHGIPTSGADWLPFLERAGGIAPDLAGFGASGKGGHLDYSLEGEAEFVAALLDELGIEAVALVGHDWGAAAGLVFAQRHPERVKRVVLINAQPLFGGFRARGLSRLWQRPLLGELAMGSAQKWMLARELRKGGPWSEERIDEVWSDFDQGTQRAILRLHRSTSERVLAATGGRLAELSVPSLVIWGELDPWLGPELGRRYAELLRGARLELIADAGHWPWLEDSSVIEIASAFMQT